MEKFPQNKAAKNEGSEKTPDTNIVENNQAVQELAEAELRITWLHQHFDNTTPQRAGEQHYINIAQKLFNALRSDSTFEVPLRSMENQSDIASIVRIYEEKVQEAGELGQVQYVLNMDAKVKEALRSSGAYEWQK